MRNTPGVTVLHFVFSFFTSLLHQYDPYVPTKFLIPIKLIVSNKNVQISTLGKKTGHLSAIKCNTVHYLKL